MVIVLPAQEALTPAGKPLAPAVPAFEMPVAPVVVKVILVLGAAFKAVLIHKLRLALAEVAVLAAVTVIVPVALTVPQPPVNGME